MGTLKEQSDSFSSFGKILTSIAVLCALLIAMVYKSKFLTCSSSGRKKTRRLAWRYVCKEELTRIDEQG